MWTFEPQEINLKDIEDIENRVKEAYKMDIIKGTNTLIDWMEYSKSLEFILNQIIEALKKGRD